MKKKNHARGGFLEQGRNGKIVGLVHRADGRLEGTCDHGVGHTIAVPPGQEKEEYSYSHGCDGCCNGKKFLKQKEVYLNEREFDPGRYEWRRKSNGPTSTANVKASSRGRTNRSSNNSHLRDRPKPIREIKETMML